MGDLLDWPGGCRLGCSEKGQPMLKRYHVDLTRKERTELLGVLNKGIAPACTLTRARILLAADEHKTDAARLPKPFISTPPRSSAPGAVSGYVRQRSVELGVAEGA